MYIPIFTCSCTSPATSLAGHLDATVDSTWSLVKTSSPLSQLYRTLSSSTTHGERREGKGGVGRRKEGRGGEGSKEDTVNACWNKGIQVFVCNFTVAIWLHLLIWLQTSSYTAHISLLV